MIPRLGRSHYPKQQRPHTHYAVGLNNGLQYGEIEQDYFDNRLAAAGTSLGAVLYAPGGTWTPYNTVTGTTAQVDRGQAILTPNTAPKTMVHSLTGGPTPSRPWVRALVSWDTEAVSGSQEVSVQAFGQQITGPDDDALRLDLQDDPTLGLRLSCTRIIGGAANSLGSTVVIDSGGYTAGDLWWVEFTVNYIFGSGQMHAKAYKYGAADPGWLTSAFYGAGTFPGTSGEIGIRARANAGNTNLSPARFWEFHAYDMDIIDPNLGIAYTDSGTVGVLISVSYTDNREITENAVTVPVAITPAGTDLHEITDAGSVSVVVTPSSADVLGAADAATVAVAVTPSSLDVAGFVDAATVAVKVSPSAVDVAGLGDVLTVPVLVSPSGTDQEASVDSGTVGVVISPSAVETRERTDANTAVVTITPAFSGEAFEHTDTVTVPLAVTVSGTDASQFGDSASVGVKLTPTGVDAFTGGDASTVPVLVTPTGDDLKGGVDASQVYVTVEPHRVGQDEHGSTDAATVPVTVTPVALEAVGSTSTGVVRVVTTPSSTDLVAKVWLDSGTVAVKVTPALDAEEKAANDAGQVVVHVSPSVSLEAVNLYEIPVVLTPSGTDARLYEEFQLHVVTITPAGTESELSLSTITEVPVSILPSISEIWDISEAATVPVLITPTLIEEIPTALDYLLVGTLTQKWSGVLQDRVTVAVAEDNEFTAVVEDRIYSGRYRGRGDE